MYQNSFSPLDYKFFWVFDKVNNGALGVGVILYEKYALNSGNRRMFDILISFGTKMSIIQTVPTMYLMAYRNLYGPLQNQTLVTGILSIRAFGQVCDLFVKIELILVWYITEIVFKNKYEMDEVGMAECIMFFTITLSTGNTVLVSSVGKGFHLLIQRYTGLPIDFSEKYLTNTRWVTSKIE